jgi:hypothetical protein
MYTVYRPNKEQFLLCSDNCLIFDLEDNKFRYSDNPYNCDIFPVLPKYSDTVKQLSYYSEFYSDQLILILNLFHIDDNQNFHEDHDFHLKMCKRWFDKSVSIHTDIKNRDHGIFYDFLWERQKTYFCNWKDSLDLSQRVWTYSTDKKMYELAAIEKNNEIYKHFLAPIRIHNLSGTHPRWLFRKKLMKILKKDQGYLSNSATGKFLYPQFTNDNILRYFKDENIKGGGTWYPVHNRYYLNTVASIYVESLTVSSTINSVTEKTWDPLIKGHFIIPFGYSGLIEDIKSYGFRLPDWIDYSYDSITNSEKRFNEFTRVVKNFQKTPLQRLINCRNDDLDILIHNRSLFFLKKTQSLYEKIKEWSNRYFFQNQLNK